MTELQERFRMIKLQEDKASGRQRFRKIKQLQRKVKLSDLTTHLEQLSQRSQTKVMGGTSGRKSFSMTELQERLRMIKLQEGKA